MKHSLQGLLFQLNISFAGPFLDEHMATLPLVRSKDKQGLVASVVDALKNLVPSGNHLRTDVDSGMGFLIGECQSLK